MPSIEQFLLNTTRSSKWANFEPAALVQKKSKKKLRRKDILLALKLVQEKPLDMSSSATASATSSVVALQFLRTYLQGHTGQWLNWGVLGGVFKKETGQYLSVVVPNVKEKPPQWSAVRHEGTTISVMFKDSSLPTAEDILIPAASSASTPATPAAAAAAASSSTTSAPITAQ